MIVLAGSASGLARAEEAGRGWHVDRVLHGCDVRAVAADGATVYAGADTGGVWRSDDHGRTWSHIGLENERVRSLCGTHGRVYAGTKPARVWVSPDGAGGWEPLAPFLRRRSWFWWSPAEKPHTAYVQALAVPPRAPQVLVAGIEAGALVRSTDGGRTWSGHLRRATRDPHVVAFHPTDAMWAYAGGGTGPSVSTDGGARWEKLTSGLDRRYCWAVAADPAEPGRWYLAAAASPRRAHGDGHAGAAIFRRDGDGWAIAADDLPAMPYRLTCPGPDQVVAVLGNGELRASRDRGASWSTAEIELGHARAAVVLT